MATGEKLVSVDYEVFGKVQDVFFRKYTKKKARSLGIVGWVENTERGTVVGQVQGPAEKIAAIYKLNSWSGCLGYCSDNANTIVSKNNSVLRWIPFENPAGTFGQQYHPVSNKNKEVQY